jgi:hypothetical protein
MQTTPLLGKTFEIDHENLGFLRKRPLPFQSDAIGTHLQGHFIGMALSKRKYEMKSCGHHGYMETAPHCHEF